MTRREPPTTSDPAPRLAALLAAHGELMSGRALWHTLGFRSERSFQRVIQKGTLPVPVFTLPSRRGRFARTRDVAAWLAGVVQHEGDAPGAEPAGETT
jgi:hypothetical protein